MPSQIFAAKKGIVPEQFQNTTKKTHLSKSCKIKVGDIKHVMVDKKVRILEEIHKTSRTGRFIIKWEEGIDP